MKTFKVWQAQARLLVALIASVMYIAGCGGGTSATDAKGTATSTPTFGVTNTIPANAATGVAINTKISAAFTAPVDPSTITLATFTLARGATAVSGAVVYVGVTAVFTPSENLAPNTLYTATITTGVTELSRAGNGLAHNEVWSFTTGTDADITAPVVTQTFHANGATDVAINSMAGVTFSEPMNPMTVTTATLTLTADGTAVLGMVAYTGVTAVFTPASALAPNVRYTITVTAGAKDLAGNAMAEPFTISWTTAATADATAPTVTGTIHENRATNVAINTKVGATFSEGMDPLSITTATFSLTTGGVAVPGAVSYAGVSAYFTPTIALMPYTLYTVAVTTGAKDLAGNAMAAPFTISWTTAATPDTTAPTVTGTVNANGSTEVAINTKIGATFSEWMDPLTITRETFTLTTGGNAVPGVVTYSGVSAVFTPASDLVPGTRYTIAVTTGAKDLAGNAMAAPFIISWTTVAPYVAPPPNSPPGSYYVPPVLDTTRPTVTATSYANGATGVGINAKAGATFSEAMDPLTITNVTFTLTTGGVAVPGLATYSGVNAVFSPTGNLAPNTLYTATITTGAKDLAGNALAVNYVWSWTTAATPDTTRPTVTGTVNANGATGVAINTKPGATFSEAMDPLTITNVTFTLTTGGVAVPGLVTYSGVSAVFSPTGNLAPSTLYTATITTGAKDLAGNALAVNYVWSWTTAATPDTTRPTVTATSYANGATGVGINATAGATFSEAMDPLTITNVTFTFTTGGVAVPGLVTYSGVSAVFSPTGNLAPNTLYTATITTGAKDLAGNALAVNYVWSWTTAATPDTTRPTVTGTVNANGATGVAINTKPGATFSEAMDPLTITNVTFTLTTGGVAVPGLVTYSGVSAVFSPTGNLANNTLYTATITTGAKDLAGNALAVNYVWSWTTAAALDTTPPTVTLVSPLDLAVGVTINSTVNATFSEAMDPLTVTTATFTVQAGPPAGPLGANLAGTVAYDLLTKIAAFTPTVNLASSTQYTATITTAAKDLAGNPLALNKVWSFTTGAAAPHGPAAVNLGTAGNFVILAKSAVSTTGATSVVGNIGLSPAAATYITGFGLIMDAGNTFSTSSLVTGQIYAADYTPPTPANMTTAVSDMEIAYTDAAGRTLPDFTELGAGNIGGMTLVPGLYKWGTGVAIPAGGVILSGGATDVWIFQIAQTLIVSNGAIVTLSGGAQAQNVFWQVAGQTTLGTTSQFKGVILDQTAIVLQTGAQMTGRALAQTAVTLDATAITVP